MHEKKEAEEEKNDEASTAEARKAWLESMKPNVCAVVSVLQMSLLSLSLSYRSKEGKTSSLFSGSCYAAATARGLDTACVCVSVAGVGDGSGGQTLPGH